MQTLNVNAHIPRPFGLPVQGLHSPLIRQIADHSQRGVPQKLRSRPTSTCRARYGDSEELRTQKKALEALLKTSKVADGNEEAPEEQSVQHSIRDLPLWRIQSATLPGSQAIYHVHVPHYVAMFGELLDGPKPQRFGHVYLPGGSVNLGNPAFELRPGTSAPLIGTLMEVVSHLWLEDGRLLILAVGLCRIKAVKQRQDVPHSRADVEVLPDMEDVQSRMDMAMRAVDACSGSAEAPLSAVMQAAEAAATAAAKASTMVWCDYEVAKLRELGNAQGQEQAPEEASPSAKQMFDKSKLVWRHILASLNGLKSGLKLGVNVGQDEIPGLQHLTGSGDRTESNRVMADAGSSAEGAAAHAASAAAAASLGQSMHSARGISEAGQSPLNTVAERGVPCEGPSKALKDRVEGAAEPSWPAMPKACSDALAAERQVWSLHSQVSELALLTRRLFSAPEVMLPEAVMQLDPRRSSSTSSSSGMQSSTPSAVLPQLDAKNASGNNSNGEGTPGMDSSAGQAQPFAKGQGGEQRISRDQLAAEPSSAGPESAAYPPLARARRLSYCLATALPHKFGEAEGRQAVLEAGSIASRLHLVMEVLQERKVQLSALHALEQGYSKEVQQEDSQ